MQITKKPAYAYRNKVVCDCGGDMKFTGETKMSYPARYVWKCESCKKTESSAEAYPGVQFSEESI